MRPPVLALLVALACSAVHLVCAQNKAGSGTQEKAITNSVGMKLALIPAGKFLMGSPESEAERDTDEKQHEVAITKPFYLGVCEVRQREYEQVMGKNPAFFKQANGGGPNNPVEQVVWADAVEFCRKLTEMREEKQFGRTYRLPTEAEWEYACRAGSTSVFHFGDALSSNKANCNGSFPYGSTEKGAYLRKTAEACSYPANAFGLFDMHGNVWEWCSDWYDEKYYEKSPRDNPQGPSSGVLPTGFRTDFYRVARGGCWLDEARACRSAHRFRFMPSDPYRLVGFRVACIIPEAR